MKKTFSSSWKSSTKPVKQRRYRRNAPLHVKHKLLGAHLSKELRKKYGTRSLPVRVSDKVTVLRGQFRKQSGKVENVDIKKVKVYVTKMEIIKKDGTKTRFPFEPSNLTITELSLDDKRRIKSHKKEASAKAPVKGGSEEKTETQKTHDKTYDSKPKPEVKNG